MTKVMSDKMFYIVTTICNLVMVTVIVLIGSLPFAFGYLVGLAYGMTMYVIAKRQDRTQTHHKEK